MTEVCVTYRFRKGAAILVDDGDRECFLPISQIDLVERNGREVEVEDLDDGDVITVTIPEWLAIRERLV